MKILVIQQKMIGDVLATSILFEAIKHKYPNAQLHYVINSHTLPVVENNPFIDTFHFFTPDHEKSKSLLFKFAKQLRKEKFDVVIDVYSQLSSNIISFLSKAKTKVSLDKGLNSIIYNYTFKNKTIANTNAGLAIENRLQLLKPLNINDLEVVRPKIYLTEDEKNNAQQFLESHSIDLKKPIYMIGVLGSGNNKTYPFKYMANVIDTIALEQPESQILFNYIPKQEPDAKAILELCKPNTQQQIYFNVFGKSLRDFLAITSHCTAVIGNEGGAINMAKALYIPTFTMFSPWIKKEAWNMFDDHKKHVSVHLKDYAAHIYDAVEHPKVLKAKTSALYLDFKPSYFETDLKAFLKRLV
ncbi:glycosyltransferase family 9 protein [Winogradskyella eckloniae]|uniref:glycosyltransferase family 9 protein n=1 Tax=Winogradskyella eckloniae TaxID=1089306 RepID=UPI0015660ACF|nr:glycosyltransferase family 9 protein [Winogradskyella eckloniae]NRD19648.1 glycosyltransferase family 9 protein [Winogradskyella eckloniae]